MSAALLERFPVAGPPPFARGVWIIHGPGVDDSLVGHDLVVRGFEQVLWECLHRNGFERIVFTAAQRSFYYFDADSHRRGRSGAGPRRPEPPRSRMRFGSGPLGDRIVLGNRSGPGGPGSGGGSGGPDPGPGPGPGPDDSTSHGREGPRVSGGPGSPTGHPDAVRRTGEAVRGHSSFSDAARARHLKWLMSDDSVRTAVVIVGTDTWLHHLAQDARRDLSAAVADWLRGRTGRGNLCVMLFARTGLADITRFVGEERYLPALAHHLQTESAASRAVTQVGMPSEREIARVVQVARLGGAHPCRSRGELPPRLQVEDWPEYHLLVRQMSAQPGIPARVWLDQLHRLAESGAPLSATVLRERNLVIGVLPDGRSVTERIEAMIGLRPVKDFLTVRQARIQADSALSAAGSPDPPSPHLLFLGNPGTGKTTVARLVGEMYRDLGLLARGHVVECVRSDLVSENVGGTARLTRSRVEQALDGVLFIDEAYDLAREQDPFGQEAVNTLLREMENHRDRLVVIAAGYPGPMEEFLRCNPGLPSRFPERNRVTFPDYTAEELFGILAGMLADRGFELSAPAEGIEGVLTMSEVLRAVVDGIHRTATVDFGNAREMRELSDELIDRWATRARPVAGQGLPPLSPGDVPERLRKHLDRRPPTESDVLAELDDLVGLAEVKSLIRQLVQTTRLDRRRGLTTVVAPHLLFVGAPGTGKTTVARIVGRLFATMGLLRSGHVVEARRGDLVAGYIGQTAAKTRKKAEQALDGVLFIDEAYDLAHGGEGDFGAEAVAELVAMMENERGRLVVIAAGYEDRMARFLDANEGLASRFGTPVRFAEYSDEDLLEILTATASARDFTLAPGVLPATARWLADRRARAGSSFGNAREARGLFERMVRNLATRLAPVLDEISDEEANLIMPADVPGTGT